MGINVAKDGVSDVVTTQRQSHGMCSISPSNELVPEDMVRRMARALMHRGPDEDGFFSTGPNSAWRRAG